MQKPLILGLVLSLTAVACAPVASSVPKVSRQQPMSGDVVDSGNFSLGMKSSLVVKTIADFSDYEKTIPADYEAYKFADREPESELAEARAVKEMNLPLSLNKVDFLVVFVVKNGVQMKSSDVNLEWLRGKDDKFNKFSFSIPEDGTSDETWSSLKKNISQVAVYYRATKL